MSDWFTDEQVEKAAIALRLEKMRREPTRLPWEQIAEIFKDEYRSIARAALRAVNPFEWRDKASAPDDQRCIYTLDRNHGNYLEIAWLDIRRGHHVTARGGGVRHEFTDWLPVPPSPQEGK